MSSDTKHLRPQSIGQLLDDTFRTCGHYFRTIAVATLAILLPYLILQDFFTRNVDDLTGGLTNASSAADISAYVQSVLPQLTGFAVILLVSALFVTPLLYGALSYFLAELKLNGSVISFKQAFPHAWRRVLPMIGTILLKWLLMMVGSAGAVAVVVLLLTILGNAGVPGILVGILAGLLFLAILCVYVWIVVKLAFTTPITVVEPKAGWTSMVRSWQLVKGNFWRVLGYLIIIQLIAGAASFGLSTLFHLIPNAAVSLVLTSLVTLVITPFTLTASGLMYLDLCARKDEQGTE